MSDDDKPAPMQMIAVHGTAVFAHEIVKAPAAPLVACVTKYPDAQCTCGRFLITWGAAEPRSDGGPAWLT